MEDGKGVMVERRAIRNGKMAAVMMVRGAVMILAITG